MKREIIMVPFGQEAQEAVIRDELAELELRDCPRVKQEVRESFRRYSKGFQIRDWIGVE